MKKKRNRKGFSLPLSLVFLLVTVMLSMVLISAALSALAQVKKSKENKQASLTVTSTATVLADTISKMEFEKDPDGNLIVKSDNGAADLAKYICDKLQAATLAADGFENATLKMKETNTSEIEARVIFYSLNSSDYPGDIVISLSVKDDGAEKTADYKATFRMDGWFDEASQVIQFGETTFYSGSEVYQ